MTPTTSPSSASPPGLSLLLRSPAVLALLALVAVQQVILVGKLTVSIGGTGGIAGGSDHDRAMAAASRVDVDSVKINSVHVDADSDTGTGTPPHYDPTDPLRSALLFLFCPGGAHNATVSFVEQAVMSSRASGFHRRHIVIIDTSPTTHCYHGSEFLRREVGYVYPTIPSDLNFAMLHNVAWRLAQRWNFPHYFWQHADVLVTDVGETETFAHKAMRIVANAANGEDGTALPPNWGVVHFAYDLFAAYKTEAVAKVRWDQGIDHYLGDCDFHIRIQFAGYRIVQSYAGIVLHMKALLPEEPDQPVREIVRHSMEYYKERGAFETRPIKENRLKHSTNPNKMSLMKSVQARLDVQGVPDRRRIGRHIGFACFLLVKLGYGP